MPTTEPITLTRQWLETIVIGLQLCPFAKKPFKQDGIRYALSSAVSDEERIDELIKECQSLDENKQIETSLIIYPQGLEDFFDYGQFVQWANSTIKNNGWQGVYQIASFHPDYVFANTHANDRENFTNRAPYPIIHLLRESTLAEAIDTFPDTESIPAKNIATMQALSEQEMQALFRYLWNL